MPPFAPTVPCETQDVPDLDTIPGEPPPAIKVNHATPEYQKESQRALAETVTWLREQIKREGLDDQLRVTPEPLTRAQLQMLEQAGR
jgi:hypothetical protein